MFRKTNTNKPANIFSAPVNYPGKTAQRYYEGTHSWLNPFRRNVVSQIDGTIIKSEDDPYFPAFREMYESSFPLSERRSPEDRRRLFSKEAYTLEAWAEGGRLVGFLGWWDCGDLRFVEHFAIHPACRSRGYGSRFLSEWMRESDVPVLLEIEPATDETTRRRQRFYHRLGFKDNDIVHYQPPYHRETQSVHLWLMSFPQPLTQASYEKFKRIQQTEIMPSFH
jgi:ribosomal protein S18 acetylase RimI-like enzyme